MTRLTATNFYMQLNVNWAFIFRFLPAHLPPVGVLLVDDMKYVSFGEGQPRLFTGDQVVRGRIIAEVWLQINLEFTKVLK